MLSSRKEKTMNRRDMLKTMGLGVAGAFALPHSGKAKAESNLKFQEAPKDEFKNKWTLKIDDFEVVVDPYYSGHTFDSIDRPYTVTNIETLYGLDGRTYKISGRPYYQQVCAIRYNIRLDDDPFTKKFQELMYDSDYPLYDIVFCRYRKYPHNWPDLIKCWQFEGFATTLEVNYQVENFSMKTKYIFKVNHFRELLKHLNP